jgi:hypothetical protein
MKFISALNESDEPFKDVPFDGILGLALPQLSEELGFSLMDAMVKDGLLQHNLFSVFFAAESSIEESEVLFGDIRAEHMAGPLTWVPVTNPGFWQVAMHDVHLNNESLGLCGANGCQVAVDTGTSLLAGPTRLVRMLMDKLRVAADCSNFGSLPDVGFLIGGQVLSLAPHEYVDKSAEGCVLGLMALDIPAPRGSPLFVLGDPFLRKYYTVYDRERLRVGFALAHHRVTTEIQESSSTAEPAAPAQEHAEVDTPSSTMPEYEDPIFLLQTGVQAVHASSRAASL